MTHLEVFVITNHLPVVIQSLLLHWYRVFQLELAGAYTSSHAMASTTLHIQLFVCMQLVRLDKNVHMVNDYCSLTTVKYHRIYL